MNNRNKCLVDEVREMLEQEFPRAVGLSSIPDDRLKSAIKEAELDGDSDVTVKIPSYHEFSMSLEQARAVYAYLTKHDRDMWSRSRF